MKKEDKYIGVEKTKEFFASKGIDLTMHKVNFHSIQQNSCSNCVYNIPEYEGESCCANSFVLAGGDGESMYRSTWVCDEHKHNDLLLTWDVIANWVPNTYFNLKGFTVSELLIQGIMKFGYLYDDDSITTIRDSENFFDGFIISFEKISCNDCVYQDDCTDNQKYHHKLCNKFSLLWG